MILRNLTPQKAMAILEADNAIAWARITSKLEIQRMNKHTLDYIDLHPDPIDTEDEPGGLLFWLYVASTVVVGAALLVILMGWS